MNQLAEKPVVNILEAWPVYDTIAICNTFYGSESVKLGWYNSFVNFAAKETHSFYKDRTEGNIGLQYCNKQSIDTMDYVYHAFSLGLAFKAPSVRMLGLLTGGAFTTRDVAAAHWWEVELPRHCAIQFKVQQNIVAEVPAMMASPGYGPIGSGCANEHELVNARAANGGDPNPYFPAVINTAMTQGIPALSNRFRFPNPMAIPRTSTIEAILHVSDYARGVLANFGPLGAPAGPMNYIFPTGVDAQAAITYEEFPARFMIQFSLIGVREVQQRGQLHS